MNRTSRVLLAVVAGGIPAALVWWAFAEPSRWLATERGLVLTEGNATGDFQVVAVFVIVGIVFGVLTGVAVHRLTRPGRWETVVGLAAASSAASLVCWRLGIWLGPPPPEDVKGLEVGDEVSAQFGVDGIVPFLVWPLVAVLSYTLALYLSSDGEEDREEYPDEVSERSEP
ncbi:hypothetical protein [Aeromicrobium choanae]|uniref:hypothetical protein n=1 Tax=Aeromicrobium choanae TaxID=1736691 RepID=UPI00099A5543|nr:hypothetical protein [Aeromicrobium choanae]